MKIHVDIANRLTGENRPNNFQKLGLPTLESMVSVVIPVFNALRWITSIAQSIRDNQDVVGEVILVNDGNAADFEIVVRRLVSMLRVPIYSYSTAGGEGPGIARNIGIDVAGFDLVAFLDCDDQWNLGSLKKRIKCLFDNEDAAFVYSSFSKTDENGCMLTTVIVPPIAHLEQLLVTNFIATPTVVLRKSRLGALRFKSVGHEDYDLWLRILRQPSRCAVGVVDPIIQVRVVPGSRSSIKIVALRWHFKILGTLGITGVARAILFVGYAINAVMKRQSRHYRPVFFGLDRFAATTIIEKSVNE